MLYSSWQKNYTIKDNAILSIEDQNTYTYLHVSVYHNPSDYILNNDYVNNEFQSTTIK